MVYVGDSFGHDSLNRPVSLRGVQAWVVERFAAPASSRRDPGFHDAEQVATRIQRIAFRSPQVVEDIAMRQWVAGLCWSRTNLCCSPNDHASSRPLVTVSNPPPLARWSARRPAGVPQLPCCERDADK